MTNETEVIPPSYFANLGEPMCSCWGKSEIEWVALAYVRALANDGDTWKPLSSRKRVYELLSDEQKNEMGLYAILSIDSDRYEHWFELVRDQLTDSEGAFGVRGFWHRRLK